MHTKGITKQAIVSASSAANSCPNGVPARRTEGDSSCEDGKRIGDSEMDKTNINVPDERT